MKKDTTLKIPIKDIESQKNNIINILQSGGVGVLPTDTIYGIVGQALNQKTVEKIYDVKNRDLSKPLIILINSFKDLKFFNIRQIPKIKSILDKFWPGKVSIIIPVFDKKLTYLHRGANSLAFRMPDNVFLRQIISKTGPLVAPSANLQGNPPVTIAREIEKYFQNKIDFYVDGGKIQGFPSKLIKIEGENILELRK